MIDFWKLTKGFKVGDTVQRFAPGTMGLSMSPFVGRVTCVHRGLGMVDVQWPYGNEQVLPNELVQVDSKIMGIFPPTLDQTYLSVSVQRDLQASVPKWRTTEVPAGFHRELARQWSKGASEVAAYDAVWDRFSSEGMNDDAVRSEIEKFYLVAHNLIDFRLQQHVRKTAAYWAASNRQYRATSDELSSRRPSCPKCGTSMKKTTYKMMEGSRTRLFACPKDLFLLKQSDILGPTGEPVEW